MILSIRKVLEVQQSGQIVEFAFDLHNDQVIDEGERSFEKTVTCFSYDYCDVFFILISVTNYEYRGSDR